MSSCLLRSHQATVFSPQSFLVLFVLGVERYAVNWANFAALGFVKMANALGAFVGINLVIFFAHVNGIVRAFGLAHVTIDAFIGNHQSHN
jgi:hypothetical protein